MSLGLTSANQGRLPPTPTPPRHHENAALQSIQSLPPRGASGRHATTTLPGAKLTKTNGCIMHNNVYTFMHETMFSCTTLQEAVFTHSDEALSGRPCPLTPAHPSSGNEFVCIGGNIMVLRGCWRGAPSLLQDGPTKSPVILMKMYTI